MHISTLTVVGVGLIGASVGLAVRARRVADRVIGCDPSPTTLAEAVARGAIDEGVPDLRQAVAHADIVIFCAPVDRLAALALEAATFCRPGTLLTDAGSTKAALIRDWEKAAPPGALFVGSHPLAGSEKQGPRNAIDDLFQGRVVLVTPTPRTDLAALAKITAFWQALGAQVRSLDPEAHDQALALTSHLPHLTAAALAGLLPPDWAGLTAGGFRDATRVAGGDPALWEAIFSANRLPLLDALARLQQHLGRFEEALRVGDPAALQRLLEQGRHGRDALSQS
jgi:prephenate dehydrogenase